MEERGEDKVKQKTDRMDERGEDQAIKKQKQKKQVWTREQKIKRHKKT